MLSSTNLWNLSLTDKKYRRNIRGKTKKEKISQEQSFVLGNFKEAMEVTDIVGLMKTINEDMFMQKHFEALRIKRRSD